VRIPKTSIRTTWRADWLIEFGIALVVLAFFTREIIFAVIGAGILLLLASLGLLCHQRLGTLRRELDVVERLPRARVVLGDTVEGDMSIRNRSRFVARIVAVTLVVEKGLSFRPSSFSRRLLRPGGALSSKFEIISQESGRFQISGLAVTFADTRDLYVGEVKYAQTVWVEVFLGMRTRLPLTPLRIYGGSPEILRRVPAGIDYADTREYVPGDEYHRVEWKATARLRRLMVKEFHPETQTTLQILIDAGRTMHQQSYVGTKLDEALAVASLLTASAVGSGNSVGIWFYNETEVVKAIEPAKAKEQLNKFANLALAPQAQPGEGLAAHATPPTSSSLAGLGQLLGERMTNFLRVLNLNLSSGYRRTGMYKALTEARRTALEGFFIILTNPRTMNEAICTASTPLERNRVIVVLIGAPWRLSSSLEKAYDEYQKASRAVQRLQQFGLTIFDLRPERLIEAIVRHISTLSR